MARVSVQIADLAVMDNGLAGRPDIRSRFLFQWVHPQREEENPAQSFTVASTPGPLASADLNAVVPDGIVFKNMEYSQVFGEPLTLQIHHFLDAHRDIVQIGIGKVFELVLANLLGQVALGPISLNRLVKPAESLKLSADTYSLKIGYLQVTVDPSTIPTALPPLSEAIATTAKQAVRAFGPAGPSGPPPRITVVSAGQVTSAMTLHLVRS